MIDALAQAPLDEVGIGLIKVVSTVAMGAVTAGLTAWVALRRDRGETNRSITATMIQESASIRKDLQGKLEELRKHDEELAEKYWQEKKTNLELQVRIGALELELVALRKRLEDLGA